MKHLLIVLASVALAAQMPALARPVNYDESKVAPYTLEDPLTFADGTKLKSPDEWPRRRAGKQFRTQRNPVDSQGFSCMKYAWSISKARR